MVIVKVNFTAARYIFVQFSDRSKAGFAFGKRRDNNILMSSQFVYEIMNNGKIKSGVCNCGDGSGVVRLPCLHSCPFLYKL